MTQCQILPHCCIFDPYNFFILRDGNGGKFLTRDDNCDDIAAMMGKGIEMYDYSSLNVG